MTQIFRPSGGGSGGGAPTDATYITQTPDGTLSAEQALSALSSGIMRVATTTGVITSLGDVLPTANGGTGVNNAGTLTNASNTTITGGGTLALGGFTLTVPATGSAALLATANVFTAAQSITVEDAVTNTTTVLATLGHNSSGTPAASFGSRLLFTLESTTTVDQNAAAIDAYWTTATHASRTSALAIKLVNSAAALADVLIMTPSQMSIATGSASGYFTTSNGNRFGLVGQFTPLELGRVQASSGGLSATTGFLRLDTNIALFSNDVVSMIYSDAATNTVKTVLVLSHDSSGTPAASFGTGLSFQGQTTTTADTAMSDIQSLWATATHASRKARVVHNVYDTAAREALRIEADGSAAMIGFLGASAVVRQTLSAAASDPTTTQTLANDLRTALINLGLAA